LIDGLEYRAHWTEESAGIQDKIPFKQIRRGYDIGR
jgi:hypothetical protein